VPDASHEAKPRILLVEDEEAIRRGLCDVLIYHGYQPVGVGTGSEGLREALAGDFELLILDVMLPEISGLEICRRTRAAKPEQAILLLTARGSERDVLEGFEAGADDYVTKPFSISQLLARVRALLRRAGREAEASAEPFEIGPWKVDPAAQKARHAGEEIELSARELAILELFRREAGRIVSRNQLLHEVWGYDNPERIETRTVDMQIGKLRRKLDPAGELIETVRGAGYRLVV
jgi:two-component system response regulator RegX3